MKGIQCMVLLLRKSATHSGSSVIAHVLPIGAFLHQGHLVGIPVRRARACTVFLVIATLTQTEDLLQAAGGHLCEDGVGVGRGLPVKAELALQSLFQHRTARPVRDAGRLLLCHLGVAFAICAGLIRRIPTVTAI